MDKIEQLQERKAALLRSGERVRSAIASLCDEGSFVELSSFSFSKEQFFGKDIGGEGVVTGFLTINDYPFYVVAQNFAEGFGGLTKANCDKISQTLCAAQKNQTPVIYLLHSQGVKLSEGIDVLEGISKLLAQATSLKGTVPQYAVICGEVYGSLASLAALCDLVFFTKEGALAITSPLVLAAKEGKNLKKEEVGGYNALKQASLPTLHVNDMREVASYLSQITELEKIPVIEAELNESTPQLNVVTDAKTLKEVVIEESFEIGANCHPEVKTILGRVGGIAVAAVVFEHALLNEGNLRKITDFASFAALRNLPFVTFVDCVGAEQTLAVNNSPVLKEIADYLVAFKSISSAKISVVTGKAAGLGYSLFAAKSAGFDFTYALANAQVSLFDSVAGAEIEYANEKHDEDLFVRYLDENADPINAAKGGYLDNVVEPQFLKQYLIASLQMLLR